jgi:hypothetical protein
MLAAIVIQRVPLDRDGLSKSFLVIKSCICCN